MKTGNVAASFIAVVIGIWVFWTSGNLGQRTAGQDPLGPSFYPRLLAAILILLGILLLVKQLLNKPEPDRSAEDKSVEELSGKDKWKIFTIILLSMGYMLVFNGLGFILSTMIFIAALLLVLKVRVWWKILLTAMIVPFFLYFVFREFLNVLLPTL